MPFVGLVTRRGDLGEHNLAQVPGGYNMPRLLDDIGVRNRSLEPSDPIGATVERAVSTARSTGQPYILLLERNLTGGKDV
jgi:sulfopyruvate decarboxylase TPP-binding subunit